MAAPSLIRMPAQAGPAKRESRGEDSGSAVETLDDALYANVHAGRVPPKALADAIDMRYHTLLDAANPHQDKQQFPLRKVVALTLASGDASVVRYLCRAVGGRFVPNPERQVSALDVTAGVAEVMHENADVLRTLSEVLADKVFCRQDAARMGRELDELLDAGHKLRGQIAEMER
jgi:hypothetical protein